MDEFILRFLLPTLAILSGLIAFFAFRGISVRGYTVKELHPYYTKSEIESAKKNYIQTKAQNTNPIGRESSDFIKVELIPQFLKIFKSDNENDRFFLILGDAGVGKTTFLINLYVSYRKQIFGQKYHIKLIPLAFPNVLENVERIEEKENTILLLDGLDEDYHAIKNTNQRIEEIISATLKFKYVIITSRTQLFSTVDEEPKFTGLFKFGSKGGEYIFHKMYISNFDREDINKYISSWSSSIEQSKKKKIQNFYKENPQLFNNPLLLNLLMTGDFEESQLTKSISKLYDEFTQLWIERESLGIRQSKRNHFKSSLYEFSKSVAYEMDKEGTHLIPINRLIEFAKKNEFGLSITEIKSGSLLSRDDNGNFHFAHISIFEYFLALYYYENLNIDLQTEHNLSPEVIEFIRDFKKNKRKKTGQNNA